MDKVDIQRKIEHYRTNPHEFLEEMYGLKINWIQKQFLKTKFRKLSIINGLRIRFFQ